MYFEMGNGAHNHIRVTNDCSFLVYVGVYGVLRESDLRAAQRLESGQTKKFPSSFDDRYRVVIRQSAGGRLATKIVFGGSRVIVQSRGEIIALDLVWNVGESVKPTIDLRPAGHSPME